MKFKCLLLYQRSQSQRATYYFDFNYMTFIVETVRKTVVTKHWGWTRRMNMLNMDNFRAIKLPYDGIIVDMHHRFVQAHRVYNTTRVNFKL